MPVFETLIEGAVRSALDGAASAATLDAEVARPSLMVRERPPAKARPSADAQMALFMAGAEPGSDAPAAALLDVDLGRPRLWQLLDTYVLAETRDGLLIVDQHSAHERILFQRLMDAFDAGGQQGQRLLFPLTLKLTAPEVTCIADLSGILERVGFEVEGVGGDTVIVQAVPNPHPWFDAERAFREMAWELTHGSDLVRSARNQHERIAMTFACKGAIKAGQRLSQTEMHELFERLFETDLPYHDVHGRPTAIRLSLEELERRFGRRG
jgi:DNA mismatch repair protein MutL